jgi:deferrochelatase/peroxidase EfeB
LRSLRVADLFAFRDGTANPDIDDTELMDELI